MSKVRRLGAFVILTLVLDILLVAFVAVAFRYWPQLLIDIRYSIFARPISDAESLRQPLEQMVAAGFLTDSDARREEWRDRLAAALPEFAAVPPEFASWPNIRKAQYLARLFSRDGCDAAFGQTATLLEKMRRIREPMGLCSDHVEVFLALCNIHDVPAAEVSITNHTVARVWSRSQQQWVYIDPQFCLMARGADGRYLSVLQMREQMYRGEGVHYEFFGNSSQKFATDDPRQFAYYDRRDDFSDIVLTFGNNVLEVDRYRQDLLWLPKPARQMFYWAIGVMPGYQMILDDRSVYAWRIERVRVGVYTVATIVGVQNAATPLALAAYLLRKRRLKAQAAAAHVPPALTPQV